METLGLTARFNGFAMPGIDRGSLRRGKADNHADRSHVNGPAASRLNNASARFLPWLLLSGLVFCAAPRISEPSQATQATGSGFDSTKLYLSESECFELEDALRKTFSQDPGPRDFVKIIDSLRLHVEALGAGRFEANTAKLILEGAASRYFVHHGESLPGPWPPALVAPLMEHFLTDEGSAYKRWGVESNIIEGGGSLRLLVPGVPPEWGPVVRRIGRKLPYPLFLTLAPALLEDPPTPDRPALKIRVYRYFESYYEIWFDFDDRQDGFGYSAICRFQDGLLEVFVMDWAL